MFQLMMALRSLERKTDDEFFLSQDFKRAGRKDECRAARDRVLKLYDDQDVLRDFIAAITFY